MGLILTKIKLGKANRGGVARAVRFSPDPRVRRKSSA
jgi:hypothetical protein